MFSQLARLSQCCRRTAAWESRRFASATGLGGLWLRIIQGRTIDENALLIGLSRQTMLERQLDVVSNNIANVNTAGFKADASLFEEYLMPGAHEDKFVGSDRRISYVQDRGTFRDFK